MNWNKELLRAEEENNMICRSCQIIKVTLYRV